jgi:hypothetical protein
MNFKKRDDDVQADYIRYICDKYDKKDISFHTDRLFNEHVRNNEDLYSYIVYKNELLQIQLPFPKDEKTYIQKLVEKFDYIPIYKCFIKDKNEDGEKITPTMPFYDLDGNTTEIPATFGYIDMKENYEFWNNTLEWKFVIDKPELSDYIKYRLDLISDDETRKGWKRRLKIYKETYSPKSYKLIKSRKTLILPK